MMSASKAASRGLLCLLAGTVAMPAVSPVALAQTAPGPSATAPPSNMAARMSLRISELEGEIRRLTGRNEELSHRIRQLEGRLEKMATDMEFRLKTLEEGGQVAAGQPAGESGAAPAADAAAMAPPAAPSDTAPPVDGADRGAQVLGAVRAPGSAPPAAVAETPEQEYDRAHGLIIRDRDYVQAEKVLTGFIADHPGHKLVPNAYYWLGRTYYVRNDFERAAATFAEGFQKHPDSKKAPATLLNLGMSLTQLGKPREACTTYAHLERNFPDAEGAVKRRLAAERKTANCGG